MEKPYDYYICMGWFDKEQEKNYEMITSALKKFDKILFEPRYDAGEMGDGPLTLERAKKIFKADLDGIDKCKALFADISFRDTGGLVEIGYAIAKGIPVILFDNSNRPKMNIMLAGSAKNCLRTEQEIYDFLNGEDVFDLGEKEFE